MAGTDRTLESLAGGPAIVLVEPQLGENIGMVARAMANFGLTDLRLVAPRDGWPNEKARAAASRADHVIDGARVFETVREAVADLTWLLATTARPRDSLKPVRGPKSASAELRARIAAGRPAGILFGRERFGLSNEEVGLADEIVTFPVNPAFASLNIAQAVLLMSYEWMQSGGEDGAEEAPRFAPPEAEPADKGDLHRFLDHTEALLDRLGYFRPPERKVALSEKLRTTLTKANFNRMEVHALHGVLRHVEFKLDGGQE
ncbi:tRNA (cytidine/uridine-2'-O-)-methyltransferase TrmJ [Aureimonas endophytica]|uniref:tRNA (cytidine/uridine-2'-O-)-methyltransferase TrmJ n=1 Tax=Aureimonas endophytica TaxID=2027858 RepID=A0A916ZER3_9HYPH|nr:RNA methyltransferase [Aureimonas endophytica]GGD91166.1 tRNA (cytidine/uridine-2'-O-)-methyltransferase TrmJ [Aureimonas endophytica]